ncbi:MAG TPA: hypothetical protein VKE94_08530 [Gemmataceae bacterium]|nr:hypothetical protein [Gemmataceae bacterium]
MAATATVCPITRSDFLEHAKPLPVTVDGSKLPADVKEFSTRSLGWYTNAKSFATINGKTVKVQVQIQVTVIGSKELK